jgi:hypothetical protein
MSRKSCVCKYFPNPNSEICLDFEFGEKKKGCELCSFNTENKYPKTTFDMINNDDLDDFALLCEETSVNYIESLKKISYDNFNDQAVMAHGLLHVRMLSAIRYSDVETVTECLLEGLNVNNEFRVTAGEWSYLHAITFHDSVRNSKYRIMKLLIGAGANVNSIDYDGETPLFLLGKDFESLDFIGSKLLMDAGANPNFCNFDGETPQDSCISLLGGQGVLHGGWGAWATLESDRTKKLALELLTLYLENGGVLTDMIRLAQNGCDDPVLYRIFLKAGADPYLKSTEGHNALYYLCNNNWECPQLKKSIILLTKVTTMTLEKSDIELQNGTECSICYSGKKNNFCETLCCKQHLHVECLGKWLVSESNIGCKSCPFCRSTVKKVNIVTIKPTFTPVNVSKRSSERGLIFSYLFETKVSESGVTMYKI